MVTGVRRVPALRSTRRTRSVSGRVVAALAALAVTVGACGSRTSSERVDDLTADLITETDGALDETQARCVASALDNAYGDEAFQSVIDAVAGDDSADVRAAVIAIFSDCDALDPLLETAD